MDKKLLKLVDALLFFGEEVEAAGCGSHVKEQILEDLLSFLIYIAGDREKADQVARLFLENGIPANFREPDRSFGERIPKSLYVFVRADREADDGLTKREDSAAFVLVEIFRILGEKISANEDCPDGAKERLTQYMDLCQQAFG